MSKNVLEVRDLKDMLNKTRELYGDRPGYKIKLGEENYKTYTHSEIRDMVNYLGTALISLGLKNKRIAVIGENRYEWELAYLSIVCGTGIVVPLDKSLPANELEELIERSEVEAIFYSRKYEEIVEKIKSNFDLTPKGIIKYLDLKKPIYKETTNYGHFGKENLAWEKIIKL
jgi:long-chain acyl-CoA synthetase